MMDKQITELAEQLGLKLKENKLKIVTAESCTGGGIAQAITEIPGSSAWFDRGFVTYSNQAKVQMLQVKQVTLDNFGAVSDEVAREMVEGALANSDTEIAISVTGIAGPTGGAEQKPVGTVYIAWGMTGGAIGCKKYAFLGDRTEIRQQTVVYALTNCLQQQKIFKNIKVSLYQKSEIFLKQLLKQKLPENSHYFLFGSRAKGSASEMADIDIGILAELAIPKKIINNINEEIEESFVPYKVDLIDFKVASEAFTQQALKKVIPWN
ncbi:MAG: nicotinamide-nucleotide amidohydrolase family protein [Methylomarinum sp.]|nr:nicotinamide-nucleotide amidohydrolase family protein [Methylomarinum sp.]